MGEWDCEEILQTLPCPNRPRTKAAPPVPGDQLVPADGALPVGHAICDALQRGGTGGGADAGGGARLFADEVRAQLESLLYQEGLTLTAAMAEIGVQNVAKNNRRGAPAPAPAYAAAAVVTARKQGECAPRRREGDGSRSQVCATTSKPHLSLSCAPQGQVRLAKT